MQHAGFRMDHDRLVAAHQAATSPFHSMPEPSELLDDLVGHAWLDAEGAARGVGQGLRGVG